MKLFIALAWACAILATTASGADLSNTNSENKGQYNLFNPAPRELLRPINSDQYDNVFDAHTLDAGHFQVEGNLVNYYQYSAHYNVQPPPIYYGVLPPFVYRFEEYEYSWGPRFRVGLLDNLEFEVNPTYKIISSNAKGAYFSGGGSTPFNYTTRSSQFGDIGLGPKFNFWGNDSGPTALAIHPYLSVPAQGGPVLGGADVPFDIHLPWWGLYLKLDTGVSLTENDAHSHYTKFDNSISVHRPVCSRAEAYWYLDSYVFSDPAQAWYGYTGFGAIYNVTPDLQLFAGMGFGLVSAAFDYNPRFGIVFRY